MSETVLFSADVHEYRDANGVTIPNVTSILERVGIGGIDPMWQEAAEAKAEIGTEVHRVSPWVEDGTIDWETVDPKCSGYLRGFQDFIEKTGFKTLAIEEPKIYTVNGMRYAGTRDRTGLIGKVEWIIDLKCGAQEDALAWGCQIAAYERGERSIDGKFRKKAAVHLLPTGKFRFREYNEPKFEQYFMWALGLEWAKRNHYQ